MSPIHQLGLLLLPGIGHLTARRLLDHYGSEEAVFREAPGDLSKLSGKGAGLARSFQPAFVREALRNAETELNYLRKKGVKLLFYLAPDYPRRLKHCYDAPVVLFYKGSTTPDHKRVLAIVGSRRATAYGRKLCASLVEALQPYEPLIISGLAYGIDVTAHETALSHGLPTFGVLGHGIAHVYPRVHRSIAKRMLEQGGLLTEFFHQTMPIPGNFPRRNRIIAGLSDAVVVIEAAEKGGALITADIAASYDREVFTLPGRLDDRNSRGCLQLIKENKAQMITCAEDIARNLDWNENKTYKSRPFLKISAKEQRVVRIIEQNQPVSIGFIAKSCDFSIEMVNNLVVSLEILGLIEIIPGGKYISCAKNDI